jgi:hypothetical protein
VRGQRARLKTWNMKKISADIAKMDQPCELKPDS